MNEDFKMTDSLVSLLKACYMDSLNENSKKYLIETANAIIIDEPKHRIVVNFCNGISTKILYKKSIDLDKDKTYRCVQLGVISCYPTKEGVWMERNTVGYDSLKHMGIVDRIELNICQIENIAAFLLDFPDYWENDKIMDILWPGTNQKDEVCKTNE